VLHEMCISKICSLRRGEKKRKAEQKVQLKRTDQEFDISQLRQIEPHM